MDTHRIHIQNRRKHITWYLENLVLQSFKKLHRTRMKVFAGDSKTLNAARLKINEEYNKNKHITIEDSIKTMIKFAEDVEKELRTHVIQACEIRPGVFGAKLTEDTLKLDNLPYDDSIVPNEDSTKSPCCQDTTRNK